MKPTDIVLNMSSTVEPSAHPGSRGRLILLGAAGLFVLGGLTVTLWGWADWRGFCAHPARATLAVLVVIRFAMILWHVHPNITNRGRDDKRIPERAFFALISTNLAIVTASPYFDARELWVFPGGDAVRYAGLALFAAGLVLAHWAQAHLGRLFSGHITLQEGHQLVTDGPFARIRHPRYAGLMLLFLGLALVFRSITGTAAALCCAVLFLQRIPREESMMAREFGGAWADYMRRTKRLIPGIY